MPSKELIKNAHMYNEINNMSGEIIDEFFRVNCEADILKKKRKYLIMRIRALRQTYFCKLAVVAALVQSQLKENAPVPMPVERTEFFWEVDCQMNGDDFFRKYIRMKRASFDTLCGLMSWPDVDYGESLSKEKKIACALHTLGSTSTVEDIGKLFGISASNVTSILQDFCKEAWRWLWPGYMKHFPLKESKIDELVKGFEEIGFPQCLGVIDSQNIKVIPPQPTNGIAPLVGQNSTVLMALVDASCNFVYVHVGGLGIYTGSEIFNRSQLKTQLLSTCHKRIKKFGDVNVPLCIIGSGKFDLSKNLMKPYPLQLSETAEAKLFNERVSKCSRSSLNAFSQLFTRFRRLISGVDNRAGQAASIIRTCCVLHNFLRQQNDTINGKCFNSSRKLNYVYNGSLEYDSAAKVIRNALAAHFATGAVDDDDALYSFSGRHSAKMSRGEDAEPSPVMEASSKDVSAMFESLIEE